MVADTRDESVRRFVVHDLHAAAPVAQVPLLAPYAATLSSRSNSLAAGRKLIIRLICDQR